MCEGRASGETAHVNPLELAMMEGMGVRIRSDSKNRQTLYLYWKKKHPHYKFVDAKFWVVYVLATRGTRRQSENLKG